MATAAKRESAAAATGAARASPDGAATAPQRSDGAYVVPVVHTHVPAQAVEWGFWATLAGATVLGAVDPPLALLVGAGVIVARHRRR